MKLGVWRGGKLREMVATLNEKTSGPWQPQPAAPSIRREQEPFGFAIDEGARPDERDGVRIASIDLRSGAYRAGLREGDLILEVDGKSVPDKSVYRKVISALGKSAVSRLYVRRGSKALYFGLRR